MTDHSFQSNSSFDVSQITHGIAADQKNCEGKVLFSMVSSQLELILLHRLVFPPSIFHNEMLDNFFIPFLNRQSSNSNLSISPFSLFPPYPTCCLQNSEHFSSLPFQSQNHPHILHPLLKRLQKQPHLVKNNALCRRRTNHHHQHHHHFIKLIRSRPFPPHAV